MLKHMVSDNVMIKKYSNIIHLIFQGLLVSYLILIIIEEFLGVISLYINLNFLLILILVFGSFSLLYSKEPDTKKEKISKSDHLFIIFVGVIGGILIYLKTQKLDWLSYVISISSTILIIISSYFVLNINNQKNRRIEKSVGSKNRPIIFYLIITLLILISLTYVIESNLFVTTLVGLIAIFTLGYLLSLIMFPKKNEEISYIERIPLCFALGIVIIPLTIFYLNLFGVKINTSNLIFMMLVMMGLFFLIYKKDYFSQNRGFINENI